MAEARGGFCEEEILCAEPRWTLIEEFEVWEAGIILVLFLKFDCFWEICECRGGERSDDALFRGGTSPSITETLNTRQ